MNQDRKFMKRGKDEKRYDQRKRETKYKKGKIALYY